MSIGFRGFRRPETISDEALSGFLTRTGLKDDQNLYALYTGGEYRRRRGSARSQALYSLNVEGKPVRLADFLTLAARIKDPESGVGFDPATVRSGLFLHQGAKPAVYLALERRADGAFIAARDVPTLDEGFASRMGVKSLKRGDVVIPPEEAAKPAEVQDGGQGRITEARATKALPAPKTARERRAGKGK